MFSFIADQILEFLQRRCKHPGCMVAVDVLDGCGKGIEVGYCRRCGAVRINWDNKPHPDNKWRTPSPNMWRGL